MSRISKIEFTRKWRASKRGQLLTRRNKRSDRGKFVDGKKSATARGYVWELSIAQFTEILDANGRICHYCGTSLRGIPGSTLDRVNPKKGYTLKNVVPCCWDCNRAKGKMTAKGFRAWVMRVVKRYL